MTFNAMVLKDEMRTYTARNGEPRSQRRLTVVDWDDPATACETPLDCELRNPEDVPETMVRKTVSLRVREMRFGENWVRFGVEAVGKAK